MRTPSLLAMTKLLTLPGASWSTWLSTHLLMSPSLTARRCVCERADEYMRVCVCDVCVYVRMNRGIHGGRETDLGWGRQWLAWPWAHMEPLR